MKCMNCGNEIPAGAPNCPVCGAQVMQAQGGYQTQQGNYQNNQQFGGAVQGQYQQPYNQAQPQNFPGPQNFGGPQGQYQQPYGGGYQPKPKVYVYPGGPFGQRIKSDFTMLCSMVGAFLMALFAMIPVWIKIKEDDTLSGIYDALGSYGVDIPSASKSKSYGLFANVKEGGMTMLMPGIVKFAGVIMIILGLWLIFKYMCVFNLIPGVNLTKITNVALNEWYGPVGMLILFFVITFDGMIQFVFDMFKMQKVDAGFSLSWWFALIGLILLFVRPVVCACKKQNFYTGAHK